ncbi:MAG: magnesium transporter, partial [Verrucomicrobiota bacterium]
MEGPEGHSHRDGEIDDLIDVLEVASASDLITLSSQVHPGDIEQALDRVSDARRIDILRNLPAAVLSEWADYLSPGDVEVGLDHLTESEQREVLDSFSDDELVDFLQELEVDHRPRFTELLDDQKREVSEALLCYPEETAGGRMTTACASVEVGLTVKQALDQLRDSSRATELLSRIFVTDQHKRILGKLRLRDLAFSTWDTPISELMDDDRTSISALADQEEAAQMIARYDLMVLPVVDQEDRLIGIITHDDALEILEEESTEDIERGAGIGSDSADLAYLQIPVLRHLKRRFGWVLVLAFLALSSGWVLHAYEDVLTSYYILAIYLPMVVAAGGNTGGQAATMVIRAMSLGELGRGEFWRVVWKEGRVGLFAGRAIGDL